MASTLLKLLQLVHACKLHICWPFSPEAARVRAGEARTKKRRRRTMRRCSLVFRVHCLGVTRIWLACSCVHTSAHWRTLARASSCIIRPFYLLGTLMSPKVACLKRPHISLCSSAGTLSKSRPRYFSPARIVHINLLQTFAKTLADFFVCVIYLPALMNSQPSSNTAGSYDIFAFLLFFFVEFANGSAQVRAFQPTERLLWQTKSQLIVVVVALRRGQSHARARRN